MLFRERQSFVRKWWPLLLGPAVLVPVLVFLVPSHGSLLRLSWPGVIGPVVVVLGVAVLLTLRLDTRLDHTGAHYRLFPLQWSWRSQPWAEVARAYVRTYDPLSEYGGWGLKGTARNRALNMSGDKGLQLELRTGQRVLLGTQRPAEVAQVLQHFGLPGQDA